MTDQLVVVVLAVLTGVSLAAWLFTVAGAAYVGWRYVYLPWKILRADIKSLAEQVQSVQSEMGLRRAIALSDEEQALAERRARARHLWSGPGSPVPPTVQKGL